MKQSNRQSPARQEPTVSRSFGSEDGEFMKLFRRFLRLRGDDRTEALHVLDELIRRFEAHVKREEKVLFPLFDTKTGMRPSETTAVIGLEHRRIHDALSCMRQRLGGGGDGDPEDEWVKAWLEAHNAKGRTVLYPGIDALSSPEEIREVFDRLERMSSDE